MTEQYNFVLNHFKNIVNLLLENEVGVSEVTNTALLEEEKNTLIIHIQRFLPSVLISTNASCTRKTFDIYSFQSNK